MTDENMGKIVADLINIPYINLSKLVIPKEVLNIVPEIVAKKQQIIAFERDAQGLKLAMHDPNSSEVVDFISKKTGLKVSVYYASTDDLNKSFSLYHKDLKQSFDDLIKEKVAKDAPIKEIVDLLILYAYENRASDVHIEPEKDLTEIRFRIDGVLHEVLSLKKELHEQIISRVKVAAKLKTDEHLSAQDGKMQEKMPDEDLDIRVSVVPQTKGEKAVLRLLSSKSRQFAFSDLGMDEKDLVKVRDGFKRPYGMVLSTGPTGSGKTTTIYAIIKILNVKEVNISTIEDPVEYEIDGINQIQVNTKTNLTFASGLRSILRQDPNIIFVGEIRDPETAGIAVNAATTGHLVLSTLHTNDAATTLPRMLDMGIEPYLIASTVNVIIAQRLVRQICEKCRVSLIVYKKDTADWLFGDKEEILIYRGKGCPVCHGSGYFGRVGIFEVLVLSEEIKKLITKKAPANEIKEKAISEGMKTMLDDGVEKVRQGLTTIEEILRVTKE